MTAHHKQPLFLGYDKCIYNSWAAYSHKLNIQDIGLDSRGYHTYKVVILDMGVHNKTSNNSFSAQGKIFDVLSESEDRSLIVVSDIPL